MTDYNFTAQDFADWMAKNRKHFKEGGYSSLDISDLAQIAGFSKEVITAGLSHFDDALNGTSVDRRADMQIKLEMMAIERRSGKTVLARQWGELYDFHMTGKEFV